MSTAKASGGEEETLVPMDFNRALDYVRKTEDRFADENGSIRKQSLNTLRAHEFGAKPTQQQTYEQIKGLLVEASALLQEFKQSVQNTADAAKLHAQESDRTGKATVATKSESSSQSSEEDGSWGIIGVEDENMDG